MPTKLRYSPLSCTKRPSWPAALLIAVQIANGIWYMPQLSFFPIYLQEELGLSTVVISVIVSGALISGMVAALGGGAVTGQLGSKWALVLGLVISTAGVLAYQVHIAWLVALLWFIGGAGLSFITVGGASYLTGLSARAALGILAAIYSLSLTVGGVIGNPIAGLVIDRYGFRVFGLAELLIILFNALFATGLLVYLNDRAPQVGPLAAFRSSTAPMVRQSKVRMLIGLRALPTVFYGLLTVLIPLLLNDLSGSKALVAVYSTANLVVASACQVVAGRAADRWGARNPTLVAYICLASAGLGLALTADKVWGLMMFGVAAVAAAWSLSTLMYIWVADGVEKSGRPSAFGLLHSTWCLSMILGSLLGGSLVRVAYGLPFLAGAALNAISPFLALTYYRRIQVNKQPLAMEPASETAG